MLASAMLCSSAALLVQTVLNGPNCEAAVDSIDGSDNPMPAMKFEVMNRDRTRI